LGGAYTKLSNLSSLFEKKTTKTNGIEWLNVLSQNE
jgi:hypothetical protein